MFVPEHSLALTHPYINSVRATYPWEKDSVTDSCSGNATYRIKRSVVAMRNQSEQNKRNFRPPPQQLFWNIGVHKYICKRKVTIRTIGPSVLVPLKLFGPPMELHTNRTRICRLCSPAPRIRNLVAVINRILILRKCRLCSPAQELANSY